MIKSFHNLVNENLQEDLSYEDVSRLAELELLTGDLLKIYNYVNSSDAYTLDLTDSKLTHLPNWLKIISGNLLLIGSNIEEIQSGLIINGGIYANTSNLKYINITQIGYALNIDQSLVTKLPDNLTVNGYFSCEGIQFEKIPVGLSCVNLYIYGSNLCKFSDNELRKMFKISSSITRYEA